MPVQIQEFSRPKDQADALALLRRTQLSTGPYFIGPRPEAMGFGQHQALVDLGRLDLSYMRESTDGLIQIGAMTTLQELVTSTLIQSQAHGLLSRAARQTAHYGLRNLATVGGLVLSTEGPLEVLAVLLVLDAVLVLQNGGRRLRPLSEFLLSGSKLSPGQYPVEVQLASQPESGVGVAMERVARTPQDEPILAAVAWLQVENKLIAAGRLAVAGAGLLPQRLTEAEQALAGRSLDPKLAAQFADAVKSSVDPNSDYRASISYRREMAGLLAKRALSAAWVQGGGGQ